MPLSSHSQRVGIVYNPDKERAPLEYQRLKRWLNRHKVTAIGGVRVTSAMRSAQFVIALGGDGTVLRVARETAAWNIPVLGVNVGHLGFLAATEVGAMYRTLSRMLAGHGRVETRTMLSVSGVCRGKKFGPTLALNDAVVHTGAVGRVRWHASGTPAAWPRAGELCRRRRHHLHPHGVNPLTISRCQAPSFIPSWMFSCSLRFVRTHCRSGRSFSGVRGAHRRSEAAQPDRRFSVSTAMRRRRCISATAWKFAAPPNRRSS